MLLSKAIATIITSRAANLVNLSTYMQATSHRAVQMCFVDTPLKQVRHTHTHTKAHAKTHIRNEQVLTAC